MKKRLISAVCVLFWLAVWQVGAMALGQELLLVSPVRTVGRLLELVPTEGFLRSAAFSSARILGGFGLGLLSGTLLALLAGKFRFVRTLLSPLVTAVKAVPVASITVLALVWVSSRNLSVLVTFLIALPVVYSNMLESLDSLDPQLTEMAKLYRVSGWRRFAGVYLSQLLPGFRSAAELAIGLSWKSGAAAEVIGIPSGSIGEKLYEAKVYLETADLFAWTIAVIILSWLSEKLFLLVVGIVVRAVSGKNAFPCRCARAPEISPSVLHVEGVTKRFGGHAVLDGFSAVFQPGKTTAVMGASGCGKTTLLRIISGLLLADSGSVRGQGAGFSAVFQEDRLCGNLTAAANVRLVCGGYRSDGEIAEAFAAVGLSGCGDRLSGELSGGMKRRAALVRALLAEGGAVLLDEPFKGLDEATRRQVMDYTREMLRGRTAVIVTHDRAEAEALADEVIELKAL